MVELILVSLVAVFFAILFGVTYRRVLQLSEQLHEAQAGLKGWISVAKIQADAKEEAKKETKELRAHLTDAYERYAKLAGRMAMLKKEEELVDAGPLPEEPPGPPEITGDLRTFIEGIETGASKDAHRVMAHDLLAQGLDSTEVMQVFRGEIDESYR
jgi:hypothetical protein